MSYQMPQNTSKNSDEFIPDDHVIPFAPELIEYVLAKAKMTTNRFGRKYDYLEVGDIVAIQDSSTKTIVAQAKITRKGMTTFRDLPLGAGGHNTYRDKEHQREVLSGYYAYLNRPIADDDEFLEFDFTLVDPN